MTENKKYIVFFIKFLCSIVLGIIISCIVIQKSYNFKKMFQDRLTSYFTDSFGCYVDCKIDAINFFSPKVKCDYLKMQSYDGAWSWECCPIEIGFSWLDLLLSGVIDIYVTIDQIQLRTKSKKNKLAVLPHIMDFLQGPSLSVVTIVKSFIIKKGHIAIQEQDLQCKADIHFASITKNMSGVYKTKISFLDGSLSAYSKNILDNLSGFLGVTLVQKSQRTYVCVDSKCTVNAQFLRGNKTCFVTGKWMYDQGVFTLMSQDKSFSISPIKLYFLGDTLFTEFNLESALEDAAALFFSSSQDLSGKCSAQLRSEFGPLGFGSSGAITLQDVGYKGFEAFSFGKISFKNRKHKHKGFLSFVRKNGLMVNGGLDFDSQSNKFSCNLVNDTDIKMPSLPYWRVPPKQAKFSITCDNFERIIGNCSCCATSDKLESHIDLTSDVVLEKDLLCAGGIIGEKNYILEINLDPKITLKKFLYTHNSGDPFIIVNALDSDCNKLKGLIKFPFIKSLIKKYFDCDIQGEGDLRFYGLHKNDLFSCQLTFKNGSVSFPHLYNFLNNFKITFKLDPFKRVVIAKNSIINFHKGSIQCKKFVLHYDKSFKPSYLHVPFMYNNCFVNMNNDLFALVSGRMLFEKQKNKSPHLKGFAILERSHLRRNIFSSDEKTEYSQSTNSPLNNYLHNFACDIAVITKEPARINTEFLSTTANIDLSIKNKILEPHISGKIDFLSGSLSFPYKNLDISKGAIYFLPHQSHDPLIELVAKNKISKYNVAMYVTGSFENHNISFESSPALSQEQVIALLIAGSAQESLNVVAPALIMQTVKDSLFGSGKSKVGKKNYLGKFLKPFKKIRMVPRFIDQTGRGGLRGALEVDINDRIRAFVEKNFSLSEDTRFELEYLLSDDASVRFFRRENGDIGGEVEMRWKL
ncbi:translocation/assembly module TamB domain-containing protein [Candidatus Dependentiae bacterium]